MPFEKFGATVTTFRAINGRDYDSAALARLGVTAEALSILTGVSEIHINKLISHPYILHILADAAVASEKEYVEVS